MSPPAGIRYWLVKSEPEAFSWEQQVARGVEPWTGVRSHEAKNNLLAMRRGDHALFYHSNTGREIVGVVEVIREAYPDPTADTAADPWVCVDMRAVAPFARPVGLAELKRLPEFSELGLIRRSRLSVVPVSDDHWMRLRRLGGLET